MTACPRSTPRRNCDAALLIRRRGEGGGRQGRRQRPPARGRSGPSKAPSVRSEYRLSSNHYRSQPYYLRQVVKNADSSVVSNKFVAR